MEVKLLVQDDEVPNLAAAVLPGQTTALLLEAPPELLDLSLKTLEPQAYNGCYPNCKAFPEEDPPEVIMNTENVLESGEIVIVK